MSSESIKATHHGMAPSKPRHHYSESLPTLHPVDGQSLRTYRLERYENAPYSVPLANFQTQDPGTIQAAHKAKVSAELRAILSRLS
ncbi:hypothetical protein K449DRAFT_440256 [Hypoxylon sp. EC38]|nr:hypothetical protein K449DRAFT_440256 [Hypoxylon sp. EC38]